jgi:hypothetical protein
VKGLRDLLPTARSKADELADRQYQVDGAAFETNYENSNYGGAITNNRFSNNTVTAGNHASPIYSWPSRDPGRYAQGQHRREIWVRMEMITKGVRTLSLDEQGRIARYASEAGHQMALLRFVFEELDAEI